MNVLITGGAGFVGSNLAASCLARGTRVSILDNLARRGSEANLAWLRTLPGELRFIRADIRDPAAVQAAAAGADAIYHLAAQVAVTTSVTDPRPDFEVNALGTFNVLEAVRAGGRRCPIVYTSTNKVYGKMESVEVVERDGRYEYRHGRGAGESTPLDFYSPYGCSKGAADQYVHDYARIYGLPAVVFRMSCIYGPRQMGNEDQGWVAHFLISAALGRPVTIYGDGKQIRDLLYIDDLVRAFHLALERIDDCAGRVYNIGGGPENTLSLLELVDFLRGTLGAEIPIGYGDWRPGDQKVYVSDIGQAARELAWQPHTGVQAGLRLLDEWVRSNLDLFQGRS